MPVLLDWDGGITEVDPLLLIEAECQAGRSHQHCLLHCDSQFWAATKKDRQPWLRHFLGQSPSVPEAEGSLTGGSPFVLSSTGTRPAYLSGLCVPWFLRVL